MEQLKNRTSKRLPAGMSASRWIVMVLLCLPLGLHAQPSAYRAVPQTMAVMPGEPQCMSIVDSHLYVSFDRLMMVGELHCGEVGSFVPDTMTSQLASEVTALQYLANGEDCYFTAIDRRGRSLLYRSYRDGKKLKSKRVDLDGFEVRQFSLAADGSILVFSSRHHERGQGGVDLWYSRLSDGEWGRPVNLGARINTAGDELDPVVDGDYLFFSSTGREESAGKLNIYVTRLFNDGVVSDTAGMLQFGHSPVQHMPEPFNERSADCGHLVVDRLHGSVYWRYGQQTMGYVGDLHGNSLWGHVQGEDGKPLAGVQVNVADGHRTVATVVTDASGFYRVVLPVGGAYHLSYRLDNHFVEHLDYTPLRDRGGLLIGEKRHDVVLQSLPVGRIIYHSDLFAPGASVDLSNRGKATLDQYVRFLTDNPDLYVSFALSCDLTSDVEYNALLTAERLKSISNYLSDRLPADVEAGYDNLCDGQDGCGGATGENRLLVVLRRND